MSARIAVVGGGRAATLHAEAVRAAPGTTLTGVGGRAVGSAGSLAAATGTEDLPLTELVHRADAVIVAVPPHDVAEVLTAIPADLPVLVESPVGPDRAAAVDHPRALTAANLLHAPVVTTALDTIARLGSVHHLTVRMRVARPDWGDHGTAAYGGVVLDPGAHVLPVLLAAAGEAVGAVAADLDDTELPTRARLTLALEGGREVSAALEWAEGPPEADLEAAAPDGVVAVRLWPRPELEVDGRPAGDRDMRSPLEALGFVHQAARLGAVAAGERPPWPPIAVGLGVLHIARAARISARSGRFCHLE